MFSSIFGKRRSSPVEETGSPPIPIARPEDEFVVVGPGTNRNIYPNVNDPGTYPHRPAPSIPKMNSTEQTFHYLQGVPFSMSKQLLMSSNKDTFAVEIGDLLAYSMSKINIDSYKYDFSVEKSVLKEC